jgi:hypothetical protein
MQSNDKSASVSVSGVESDALPASSCFASLAEASHFFECGSLGYSATRDVRRLDGLQLKTLDWSVRTLAIGCVESSFFADSSRFPAGSVEFDHALIMRNIAHEWNQIPDMIIPEQGACVASP